MRRPSPLRCPGSNTSAESERGKSKELGREGRELRGALALSVGGETQTFFLLKLGRATVTPVLLSEQ